MLAERDGGFHQGEMRERLREVAELIPRGGIVFLGEQSDIVAQREEPLEQRTSLVLAGPATPAPRPARRSRRERRLRPAAGRRHLLRRGSGGANPSTDNSRWIAVTVETTRGSVAGRKPTSGIIKMLASSSSPP